GAWLDQIGTWISQSPERLHHICTVNPEFIMIAQQNEAFFRVLNGADACVADGTGVLLAAKWLGIPITTRIPGSDGIYKLAEQAAKSGWRIYLLGAASGIAEQTAAILQNRYPMLQIAGTYAGSPHPDDAPAIIERINQTHADIVLVAYGAPQQ